MTSSIAANGGLGISVVVPVYRNRETLAPLHDDLRSALQRSGLSYELIFVNDACPEHSGAALACLARDNEAVRVISFAKNRGQQHAIMKGLSEVRGAYTAVLDADLQDPPALLVEMIEKLRLSTDDAILAEKQGMYQSAGRLLWSKLFKWCIHLLTGMPRNAGSYVVMTRRMVDAVLAYRAKHPYLLGMIGCSGLSVSSLRYQRAKREYGTSSYTGAMRLKIGLRAIFSVLAWKMR